MTRRWLAIAVLLLTAVVLQSTVFGQLKLFGVRPELVFMVVILVAAVQGPREGIITGFAGGLLQDLMLNQPPRALTALTLVLVGYGVGLVGQYIVSPSPLTRSTLVGVATAAAVLFYGFAGFLLGHPAPTPLDWIRIPLLSGIYGAVLTPLVYPAVLRMVPSQIPGRKASLL